MSELKTLPLCEAVVVNFLSQRVKENKVRHWITDKEIRHAIGEYFQLTHLLCRRSEWFWAKIRTNVRKIKRYISESFEGATLHATFADHHG
jgi:hypothetical protein